MKHTLGGSLDPLIDAIKAGKIRGVVGIVGCNNPKYKHDYCNVNLTKELIKKDILVIVTGCVTTAPEWYSEKAAAIGTYAVASGIATHLGHPPNITGSELVTNLAVSGLDDLVGGCFLIEPDPFKAADLIDDRIKSKRVGLGLLA